MAAKKRKAISTKTRFDIFKRDSFTCQYCGNHPPKSILHVDHIIPVAEGGGNEMDNLTTSCDSCNMGKGARSLESVPASLASRAIAVKEMESQLRGYSEVMTAKRERIESETWEVADMFIGAFSLDGLRKDWFQSIKMFIEKIGSHECIRAMEIAIARKPWSRGPCFMYFCGICWNIVRGDA